MADVTSPDPSEQRTLWVGDIEQWMDETYVMNLFSHVGEVANVKLIRDKNTMIPSGYGFVEFVTHATASKTLESYNGQPIPNAGRSFRLNWATMGGNKYVLFYYSHLRAYLIHNTTQCNISTE